MFEVHNVVGSGFLESVYANALTIELRNRGVPVERNVPFEVMYRGMPVGRYVADLAVDQRVMVEDESVTATALGLRCCRSEHADREAGVR